jgi:hypothetical protein
MSIDKQKVCGCDTDCIWPKCLTKDEESELLEEIDNESS